MRLIDADAWIQELRTQMSDKDCPGEIQDYCLFMINEINTRPTAYDVEEVVAELEEASHWEEPTLDEDGYCNDDSWEVVYTDKAIGIVKAGGINE